MVNVIVNGFAYLLLGAMLVAAIAFAAQPIGLLIRLLLRGEKHEG